MHDATGRRSFLAAAALLVSLSALGGGLGLATGWMSLGHEIESRLPFASPVFGGFALVAVIAVPFGVLAWWAARGDRRTDIASIAIGLTLVAWLLIELAFIRELSFLHPLLGVIGIGFVLSGRRAIRART